MQTRTRVPRRLLALIVGVIVAMSLALTGCDSTSTSKENTQPSDDGLKLIAPGILTIGSDCDYPPFIELAGDQPAGFELEMMQAIGEHLGLEIEYLPPQNFDTILASVASGVVMDLGVSSFTITNERKELIDFCTPYFDSNQAVVALKSKGYASALDLDGKVVGAQSGTTGADWVNENLRDPGTTLKEYNQTSEALAAMMAGDIEAVFFDEPVAAEQVATTYTDAEIVESIATGEQYGIAVSKDNPTLKDKINEALRAIKSNGSFDRIFTKYFPDLDPPTLTP
ncbi:MAG: ABC transporter substrate-binding protein [Coriobacteriales bacterium]|jgi:polar amino acid transport system substrate-binding protein|nr:ABC transporter substrate-binding protein [Coriobacteriales bacterium]